MKKTRDEIGLNDLQAVYDAVLLLRKYDLVSVAKVREVREAVHEDCLINLNRYDGSKQVASMLDNVWRDTRDL